jgi:hypothetical protein
VGVESHDHCWKTVPALSSSPISAALEQPGLPAGDRALLAGQCPSLLEYLQQTSQLLDCQATAVLRWSQAVSSS